MGIAILFTIVVLIVALLLIGVVLIQNSKGGGLASNIGISTQTIGVKKSADMVEKATWWLIGILAILSIVSGLAFSGPKRTVSTPNYSKDDIVAPDLSQSPWLPKTAPTNTTTPPVNP